MPVLRLVAPSSAAPIVSANRAVACLAPLLGDAAPFERLDRTGSAALLRDLGFALIDIAAGRRARVVVPTEASAGLNRVDGAGAHPGAMWEIGLEQLGSELQATVFRQGARPQIAPAVAPVSFAVAKRALLQGLSRFEHERDGGAPGDAELGSRGLAMVREQLVGMSPVGSAAARPASWLDVEARGSQRCRLQLTAALQIRQQDGPVSGDVSRADLHALLFEGRLVLAVGQSEQVLRRAHVFLVAERLLALTRQVLDARCAERRVTCRVHGHEESWSVQLDAEGQATLRVGHRGKAADWRLPAVPWQDFAQAVVSFGRRLAKQIVSADRSQAQNLRFAAFRDGLREAGGRLRGEAAAASKLNGAPESYRAFAESDTRPPPAVVPQARSVGKLRFSESWRADVPGIDLRSMHLAGDRLLVGSARELACIERTTGMLLWRRRTHRAVSVLSSVGLLRLGADGRLVLHDLGDGEPLYELKLRPCVGASTSGSVVNAPGLPHMLLAGEGARHLVAVDLDSSEIRWRRPVPRRGVLRLRRAGKLMVASGGENKLLALDLLSGEEVWRHCGRHRYGPAVAVDQGEVYALSTEVTGTPSAGTLEHIDPWTGAVRWRRALPRPIQPLGMPLLSSYAVAVVTRDSHDRLGVMAFDRATGELRFDTPAGLCRGRAACLVVDDKLIANSDSGELVAICLADGATRYRHVFAGHSATANPADRPQSVQPVLRSGALFLPQTEVYVVRPTDGAMLGRLPADLVPDALRVDERCGVYVGEASGYLVAYHALPTLTLVRRI